jgi:hypothetical protein
VCREDPKNANNRCPTWVFKIKKPGMNEAQGGMVESAMWEIATTIPIKAAKKDMNT